MKLLPPLTCRIVWWQARRSTATEISYKPCGRMTAMPAFGPTPTDEEIWKMTETAQTDSFMK